MRKRVEQAVPSPFRHTQYAVYLTATFALSCIFYDSTQGIVQRYHLNKKWFYLYGIMGLFAYLYTRPLIRRQLGSASEGYINWSSIYVVWLCTAIFYHLPSLESMGIDVKGDVSMALTVFLLSLAVLGGLSMLYSMAVTLRLLSPRLFNRSAGAREVFTLVVLNSMTLAIACSTYYSLCGNSGAIDMDAAGSTDAVRAAVCGKWLQPLHVGRHRAFSRWVIYGEETGNGTLQETEATVVVDQSDVLTPAPQAISPVFTTWLTLFAMFSANCVAEYFAIGVLGRAYASLLRKELHSASRRNAARPLLRRNSAESSLKEERRGLPIGIDAKHQIHGSIGGSLDVLLKTVSSVGSLWSPTAFESMRRRATNAFLMHDDQLDSTEEDVPGSKADQKVVTNATSSSKQDMASGVGLYVDPNSETPSFLPMFPWYSGTSADLLKTLFDLVVSVKVFLGRFDQRTMQAVTADVGPRAVDGSTLVEHPPRDGDGFMYEHLGDKGELWLDFCGDTGDGGDPTYSVARCLAAPGVTVDVPENVALAAGVPDAAGFRYLPRADAFIHGGDLAYPNPTDETYEKRLFGPYQDAFPPPPHVHPGQLVVNKPNLPADSYLGNDLACACASKGPRIGDPFYDHSSPPTVPCGACKKSAVLAAYDGPTAFVIPGNHDWIDGLETFQRHIVHKGWLGGWLLPQEKSYFALRLPAGWWLFALDLALVDDLDMSQYRYFARIAEERMGPDDAAIVVTHCPHWLIDWFWGRHSAKNLRQLLRGPLRGRARVHLAGDLHFYMRHSFKPYVRDGVSGISPPISELSTPAGGSPIAGGSPLGSRCPTPAPALGTPPGQLHQNLISKLKSVAAGRTNKSLSGGSPSARALGSSDDETTTFLGSSPPADHQGGAWSSARRGGQLPPLRPGASPPAVLGGSPPQGWWPNLSVRTPRADGASPTAECASKDTRLRQSAFSTSGIAAEGEWEGPPAGWIFNDPEHLIVCGTGGAFLHPTHVFSYARFRPPFDPAAGPIYRLPQLSDGPHASRVGHLALGLRRSFPSDSSLHSLSAGQGRWRAPSRPAGGEYRCQAAFPTPERSLRLGRANLHAFRHVNSRFDVIGGALYYLLVISVLPRCSGVAAVLDATSLAEGARAFGTAATDTVAEIFSSSYVSLISLLFLFAIVLGFAKSGGVGAISGVPPAARRRPEYRGFALAVKTRLGGFPAQLTYAAAHAAAHLSAAIFLLLLLELGVETVVRYEGVGREGYHSLYRWYRTFEAQHFPDPAGVRGYLSTVTLGLYPNVIKWAFALFDIPEAVCVARTLMCEDGGTLNGVTRLQTIGYYGGVLLYFWVLATPTVGFVFGVYLYVSGNWLHVHYDESFSALQVAHHKGFLRLHVTQEGDLEIFALGLKEVPTVWREDPRWKTPGGGGFEGATAHHARWPSRWMPVAEEASSSSGGHKRAMRTATPPEAQLQVIDYLLVPRRKVMT